ncbi:hypothetical protein L2E82_51532 [Cichorium intybus]|nr:hypothetical protein L2E82_51532 [Cichorium intybus]
MRSALLPVCLLSINGISQYPSSCFPCVLHRRSPDVSLIPLLRYPEVWKRAAVRSGKTIKKRRLFVEVSTERPLGSGKRITITANLLMLHPSSMESAKHWELPGEELGTGTRRSENHLNGGIDCISSFVPHSNWGSKSTKFDDLLRERRSKSMLLKTLQDMSGRPPLIVYEQNTSPKASVDKSVLKNDLSLSRGLCVPLPKVPADPGFPL